MDERQRPDDGLSKSCILLIVIAGMERFVFKGVASNLVTYLTDVVKMSNSSAAKTVNNWCGFTSMLPLLLAPLADSYWPDRYPTILASSSLYIAGLIALTATTLARAYSPTNMASSFLFWSLYLISLGQGGYNSSLQAFGAEQLTDLNEEEEDNPKNPNQKSMFFQWWYFGVCAGSLLGVTVMSYIQDTFGWVLGFAIPMIVMVTSLVLFSSGTRIYSYKKADVNEKRRNNIIEAIKATASKFMISSRIRLPSENHDDEAELELQEKPLCRENVGGNNSIIDKGLNENHRNSKVILRLIPIWTMLLMFAVIFQQPVTFFTKQGMTMRRNIFKTNFKIPPATLQSAITFSIILLMPFYDKTLIPIAQKITGTKTGITIMQRMGIGMFLSVIAMVIAAVVESKRLEYYSSSSSANHINSLSIFWLLPQYILLGIADIFTVVGMQEFFYSEVPTNMKMMGFALYNSVFGVGSFLSALMISIIEACTRSYGYKVRDHMISWFSDDMSEARLDKYYWLLAFSSALCLILYVVLCRWYNQISL